jgi:hypothetical protein
MSTAEERLILLSAGTAARRQIAAQQVEGLTASVDWSLLTELLDRRRLLTLLGPPLLELAGDQADDELTLAVRRALDAGRRQAVLLQTIGERAIAALAGAGIRSAPLKGPALSEDLYDDPGRRPSSDVDLLVAPEQLHDAVAVVCELGYLPPADYTDEHGLPLLHFALLHERNELPPVELHWRVHWYERRFARERLLPPHVEPDGAWRAAPIDQLTALLLFYARDGFIDLRLAADLAACWDVMGTSLAPGTLDEPMRAYPELRRALLAAGKVAERTVGLPLERLTERSAELTSRGRMAARLASPHPYASEHQLYADMGLIDGLLAPTGGFRAFVKRQVLPPREVLREQAQKAQLPRASSTLSHGVRVLGRYGLAMKRLLRAPESIRSR